MSMDSGYNADGAYVACNACLRHILDVYHAHDFLRFQWISVKPNATIVGSIKVNENAEIACQGCDSLIGHLSTDEIILRWDKVRFQIVPEADRKDLD